MTARTSRRRRHAWLPDAVRLAPAVLVLGVLFGGALAGALRASVQPLPGGPVTLDAWRAVLTHPDLPAAAGFTVWVAAASTLLAAALAVAAAALLRRRAAPVRALFLLPVPVPHLVVAVVTVLWLGRGGLADRLLGGLPVDLVRDSLGLGVILVYTVKETPFLALLVMAAWTPMVDRRAEAAAVLGAGPWRRLRWVVWPAVRPALVTGMVVASAFALGALEVPLTIGPSYPPTVPELALDLTRTALLDGRAQASALLLLESAVIAVLAALAAHQVRGADA